MKKIVFFGLLLLSIGCVRANYSYTVNMSALPFSAFENITIVGTPTLLLNVTYGNFTSGPSYIYFDDISEFITINISIPSSFKPGTYQDIVSFDGNISNYSRAIMFNYLVINDTIPVETNYIELDINEFEYIVCDYSLPWNTTKAVVVVGNPGQTVQTIYNFEYFNMLNSFIIPNSGTTSFNILVTIPKNLSAGRYKKEVLFNITDERANVTFWFNIMNCLQPPPSIDDLMKDCKGGNLTIEQYMSCIRGQAEYWSSYYDAVMEAAELKIVNNTIKEYVNQTVYREILDIDNPEVISAITEIPRTWKQMQVDAQQRNAQLQEKEQLITQLQTEKTELINQIDEKVQSALVPLVEQSQLQKNTISAYEKGYISKSKIWWTIFFVLLIASTMWSINMWSENYFW